MFITLEGIEGAGKTSQIANIVASPAWQRLSDRYHP